MKQKRLHHSGLRNWYVRNVPGLSRVRSSFLPDIISLEFRSMNIDNVSLGLLLDSEAEQVIPIDI